MFVAKVIFNGPDTGGRRTPPLQGYHPQVKIGDEYASCWIESLTAEHTFAFDVEHLVALDLLLPEFYADRFALGDEVTFFEGSHLVGRSLILEVM
jgi:hypothetical protein